MAVTVQFMNKFSKPVTLKSIKNNIEDVSISINHESYRHSSILNKDTVEELIKDFINKT